MDEFQGECIHAKAVAHAQTVSPYFATEAFASQEDFEDVVLVHVDPFVAAVKQGGKFHVVQQDSSSRALFCMCGARTRVTSCAHVKRATDFAVANGIQIAEKKKVIDLGTAFFSSYFCQSFIIIFIYYYFIWQLP